MAPGLSVRLAERLFLAPPTTRRPRRESDWAAPARRSVTATDAGDLATWTWGRGPATVLLVHGWAGRGLQLGAFAAPLVAQGFRVVAFDAPGHGASPGRTSSLVEMSRGAGAMASAVGGVETVVAHSLGATAVILAAGRGELPEGPMAALAPSASLTDIVERFGRMTGFTTPVLERMRRRIARRFHFDWDAAEPLAIAPRMSRPLLVVHDSDDRFVAASEGAALAAAWPGAKLVQTSGLGHHRLLRDERVVDRVVDFAATSRSANLAGHRHRLTA